MLPAGYQLRCGNWAEMGEAACSVRLAVFVQEQGIPEAEEWDTDDADSIHAVAWLPSGEAVATGRLIAPHAPGEPAKVGRMAVLRAARGKGLGQAVLGALMAEAHQAGYAHVALHAQVSAEGFYRQSGFVAEGPVFDEVGIPHRKMVCQLLG